MTARRGTAPVNLDDVVEVSIEPVLVSREVACQMLGGISKESLDRFVKAGEITPKMLGSRVAFPVDEVRRFARDLPSWEPKWARVKP